MYGITDKDVGKLVDKIREGKGVLSYTWRLKNGNVGNSEYQYIDGMFYTRAMSFYWLSNTWYPCNENTIRDRIWNDRDIIDTITIKKVCASGGVELLYPDSEIKDE